MNTAEHGIKRCAFCARELDERFQFCPYCGKRHRPPDEPRERWYHSTYGVVLCLALLGPFALPVVWFHPRYRIVMKIVVTILVLALTVLITYVLVILYMRLAEQIRQLTTPY